MLILNECSLGWSEGTQFMCSKTSKMKFTYSICACANCVYGVFLGFYGVYLAGYIASIRQNLHWGHFLGLNI